MRKMILMFLGGLFFSACAVTSRQSSIIGTFDGQIYGYGGLPESCSGEIILALNDNEAFSLNWRGNYYFGKWNPINDKSILLKFDEIIDLSILLAHCPPPIGNQVIEIIDKDKIVLKNYILNRVQ